MAIVFPRDVPSYMKVTTRSFVLERDMSVNTKRGRPAQVIEKSDPRWSVQLQFRPLERASWRLAHAWIAIDATGADAAAVGRLRGELQELKRDLPKLIIGEVGQHRQRGTV